MQYDKLLWHDTVICLSVHQSVTKCIVAKWWYILQQKWLNKWIGSAPRNTILQLSTHWTNLLVLPPPEPQTLLPLVNTLKTYCVQANHQNFHLWNSHRQNTEWLIQTPPYYRLFLSRGCTTCNRYVYPWFGSMYVYHVSWEISRNLFHLPFLESFGKLKKFPIRIRYIPKYLKQ